MNPIIAIGIVVAITSLFGFGIQETLGNLNSKK